MNKVAKLCQQEKNAKFYYASQRMFFESKLIKVFAYLLSIVPIVLSLIKAIDNKTLVFVATMISFSLTLILEFTSSFLNNHKEKSILLNQLYQASITGTTFSKVQYDREMTNKLNELAIRKAASKMSNLTDYNEVNVPEEIDDKYSYLYLCRLNAASTNYLMSRMYAFYVVALIFVIVLFISFSFVKNDTYEFLQLIIQFYPLVLPIIRNIASSQKTMKYCTKISADIDNYFAEGNNSNEELARFIYYAQNIEFESMVASPAKYSIFSKVHKHGLKILEKGVTKRFIEATMSLTKSKTKYLKKDIDINTKSKKRKNSKKSVDNKSSEYLSRKEFKKNSLSIQKQKVKREKY